MEDYVKVPNLPQNKISLAIVDGRIPYEMEKNLYDMKIKIIKTKKIKELNPSIAFHPDMMLHHLGKKEIITAPNVDNKVVYELEENGFNVICGKKVLSESYPDDIAYNVARIGNMALCSIKNTDEVLLQELYRRGINIIDTKQGYSKCSISIISEKAIITSDMGIYKLLREKLDILLIQIGYINLFDMNYGFIGGATGKISDNELAFYGNIETHTDFNEIKSFLLKYDKMAVNLGKNILMDLGTLIPLKEYSILS